MKVGNLVMSHSDINGTIVAIDESHGMYWVEIWWSNGKFTWEDIHCSIECGSIWVIR